VAKIERGTKVAFSNAITGMFKNSWVIVALGLLVVLFLPEIPLRRRAKPEHAGGTTGEAPILPSNAA
jgi:hypothetical protein